MSETVMKMSRSLRLLCSSIIIIAWIIALPAVGVAQDGADEAQTEDRAEDVPEAERGQGRRVTVDEQGLTLEMPTGWTMGEAPSGAVALFQPSEEGSAQIEVRLSTDMSPRRAELFFASFHSNLQNRGFSKISEEEATYDGLNGRETEYEVRSGGREYRMVVWQYLQQDNAWLTVGFFPAGERDDYYDAYESLIESFEFRDE